MQNHSSKKWEGKIKVKNIYTGSCKIQTGILTFTGQGKQKCFESWNLSISKSLTPQSLFDAMKWTAPLADEWF